MTSTDRLVKRSLKLARRRPPPPRDVRFDSATNLLSWTPPLTDRDFTHYRVRVGTDIGNPDYELSSGQTKLSLQHGEKACVSTYNATTKLESVTVLVAYTPATPGSPAAPGVIASFGTVTYRHLPQKKVTEFRFIPVPPSPLGTFKGLNVFCEAPDRSGESALVADGATEWDGTKKAVGAVQPKPVLVFNYKATAPNTPAVFTVPLISSNMAVRIIAQPFSLSGATVDYDSAPSVVIAVAGYGAAKPNSATAWTENAQFGGAPAMYTDTVSGKTKRYLDFSGIVLPSDVMFAGWEIWSADWPSDTNQYAESERHTDTRCIIEVDEPASVIAVTFYLRSSGFDANGAAQRNPIVPGVTPSMSITIGTTAGTLDLQKAFNFNASEFEIDLTHGFRVKGVDFRKAIAGTFDSSTFDATSLFAIKNGGVANKHLAAESVTTPKLTTSWLDVGGGGGKPIQFRVFDNGGNLIGWIGDDSANSGYVGSWQKRQLIGGTGPANAPLFVDSSGNVIARGIYVNDAGAPLGWIGANGSETGAWFKEAGIGGGSKSTAPIQADVNGNVSINDAEISVSASSIGTTVNIDPSSNDAAIVVSKTNGSSLKMINTTVGSITGLGMAMSVTGYYSFYSPQGWGVGANGNLANPRVSASTDTGYATVRVDNGNGSSVTMETSGASAYFTVNGYTGITGTRTVKDGSGNSRTVTINGGIITDWAT